MVNHKKWQRSRLTDGLRSRFGQSVSSDFMTAEFVSLFTGPRALKRYAVWGGHSIWFRNLFAHFGKNDGGVCDELKKVKIANTGVVSATVYQTSDIAKPWVITNCKWIYLGPSGVYKLEENPYVPTHKIPSAEDFRFDEYVIGGWTCCCSELPQDQVVAGTNRSTCVLVRGTMNRRDWTGDAERGNARCDRLETWMSCEGVSCGSQLFWSPAFNWLSDSKMRKCEL